MVEYDIDPNVSEPLRTIRRRILDECDKSFRADPVWDAERVRQGRAEAIRTATWAFGATEEFSRMAHALPPTEVPPIEKLIRLSDDGAAIIVAITFAHGRCGFVYHLDVYDDPEDDYGQRVVDMLRIIYERGPENALTIVKALAYLSTIIELADSDAMFAPDGPTDVYAVTSLTNKSRNRVSSTETDDDADDEDDDDFQEVDPEKWFELSADQSLLKIRLNDCGAPGFEFTDKAHELPGPNLVAIQQCLRVMYAHGLDYDRPLIYPIVEIANEMHGIQLTSWNF